MDKNNPICPICGYELPVDNEHIKEAFAGCNDCGATCHENMETSKVSFYFPSEDGDSSYSAYCCCHIETTSCRTL